MIKPMNEIIRKDIASIIARTISILDVKEEKDIIELKQLSNHTVHNASIFQDEDSVSVAIFIYSLSKIIERKFGAVNYKPILKSLKNSLTFLNNEDSKRYRKEVKKLFSQISRLDSKLKIYAQEVIRQAQIKKGSQLYRHGISLARAAEILGISQWELMGYIGKTHITDIQEDGIDIESRIRFTRGLFQ